MEHQQVEDTHTLPQRTRDTERSQDIRTLLDTQNTQTSLLDIQDTFSSQETQENISDCRCQVLKFLLREAKLYLTWRDRIWDRDTCVVVAVWRQNIRARLNLDVFQPLWGDEGAAVETL